MVATATRKRAGRPAKRKSRKVNNAITSLKEGIGCLVPGELLTVELAAKRCGQGIKTIRAAFRKGLARKQFGRRVYILSDDLIEYIRKCPTPETPDRFSK